MQALKDHKLHYYYYRLNNTFRNLNLYLTSLLDLAHFILWTGLMDWICRLDWQPSENPTLNTQKLEIDCLSSEYICNNTSFTIANAC